MEYYTHLKALTEAIEKKCQIFIKSIDLLIKKPYSDIYILKTDKDFDYILKIGKTERTSKREYESYNYLQSIGINTLDAVFFSEEHNALLTKKRNIISLNDYLKACDCDKAFEKIIFETGKFCKDLELATGDAKILKDNFTFKDYLAPRLSGCQSLPHRLKTQIESWLKDNEEHLKYEEKDLSLSTDFNFHNIHLEQDTFNLVLVDLGDAHFWPRLSNISYFFLQFKFNHCALKLNTPRDFKFFIEGYGEDKIFNNPSFKAFNLVHMVNMLDFYSGSYKNLNIRPNSLIAFAKAKYNTFRIIKQIQLTLNEQNYFKQYF